MKFMIMALRRLGFLLLLAQFYNVKSDSCDIEIENTLRTLLAPSQTSPSMQIQALRRGLLKKMQQTLDDEVDEKSPLGSLLQTNNNFPHKRNLEALARAGYIRTQPGDDGDFKRSIANLAKNGQLPIYGAGGEESKRGIESLARNGELRQRREIQELLDELDNRRDLADLKRNIASIARESSRLSGKRNVAALYANENGAEMEKRNLASIKAQLSPKFKRSTMERNKREVGADYYDVDVDEEYQPVYQNQNMYDYENLLNALSAEKRFLGRLPQMGKPKTTRSPKTRFH